MSSQPSGRRSPGMCRLSCYSLRFRISRSIRSLMAQLNTAARDFLEEPRYCVVATINEDGTSQQTVVWYELIADHIMLNAARGRVKDRNIRRDPRISVCVSDGLRFVTISGTVTIVDDQQIAQADILRLAVRYDGPECAAEQAKSYGKQQRVTYRLSMDHLIVYGFDE